MMAVSGGGVDDDGDSLQILFDIGEVFVWLYFSIFFLKLRKLNSNRPSGAGIHSNGTMARGEPWHLAVERFEGRNFQCWSGRN